LKNKSQDVPIITLLTDFGEKDSYVGAMKGVILSICPFAKIVDLSHQIEKHNVHDGAFFLYSSAKYYPKNTIHLVVVDPGVGSQRKSIIIKSENYYFVGPDNGVLSLAALDDGVQKVVEINNSTYYRKPTSTTFHGRDIMAPVVAHLAKNEPPEKFGPLFPGWIQLEFPKVKTEKDIFLAQIIHIDRFGNIVTNITRDRFDEAQGYEKEFIEINVSNQRVKIPICTAYDQVDIGESLAIFGSSDFLEISKNQKSAADALELKVEDKMSVRLL
jgi:S-adenosylmethionine hydrolase